MSLEGKRNLDEQELLNVSGGLHEDYADATLLDSTIICSNLKDKDACKKQSTCSWDKQSEKCS